MDFSLEALEFYRLKDLLGRYVSTLAARHMLDELGPLFSEEKLETEHAITAEADTFDVGVRCAKCVDQVSAVEVAARLARGKEDTHWHPCRKKRSDRPRSLFSLFSASGASSVGSARTRCSFTLPRWCISPAVARA